MGHHRFLQRKTFVFSLFLFLLFLVGNSASAQDGKTLFQNNCASCHNPFKKVTGPALSGLEERGPWSDRKNLEAWIHNPSAFASSNQYAGDLMKEYAPIVMTPFPSLSSADINAIVTWINDQKPPTAQTPTPGAETSAPSSDNSLLFGILTLILAVIAFTLATVNSSLRKLTDDKEGVERGEPVPFYRNKVYIATLIILLFLVGGYYTIQGAIGLGRQQNYQPDQPIFYSHKVHAGINQINCLYCHGGAKEGKHANIPSVNVCMNCHMAINEYSGNPKLYRDNGTEVDGTKELQKLFEYAGYDPASGKYTKEGKPIEWVRIHSLPDHVYFNHSQHVIAGKVQCQTCHGEITNMDEVYQFAPLSMGWCINCHRETKVQFSQNGFYSIYEKFHNDIKAGKMDSTVTVEQIGGTECQKCHY